MTKDLFDKTIDYRKKSWKDEWVNMPEYNNVNEPDPKITATFKFRNEEDYLHFKNVVAKSLYNSEKVFDGSQKVDAKQAWYPLKKKQSNYYYTCSENLQPRFPVYIVSKGRWKRNPTATTLKTLGVPFYMIVEEEEYLNYLPLADEEKLLILPKEYKKDYDTFWKDGDKRTGAGCARNFAWQHSIDNGFDWHWVLDDNIESFERFNNNMKVKCCSGFPFYICEDFTLRYENIGQSGFNYANFCHSHELRPPFLVNSRIYSCILINNKIPFRWRGRYNEDTDLSLRIMKHGLCTIQFNAFLQGKMSTTKMKGGNTKEFYDKEGTYNKSKMLEEMHPDVAKVVWRFNRWHHHVDYKEFKRDLYIKRKPSIEFTNKINNFGMKLHERAI